MSKKDSIIPLAWPDLWVKQTGAGYDKYSNLLGISKNGKYKVGHAAAALVNHETGDVHYMDFGRYITSAGNGRIRDHLTDPDITMHTKAIIDEKNRIANIHEILREIKDNPACHGEGKLLASVYTGICFQTAYKKVKKWQTKGMIPYGPFEQKGTNCSRFVTKLIRLGKPDWKTNFLLTFPYTISPSPRLNVRVARTEPHYYVVTEKEIKEVRQSIFKKLS